ncbi:MAG: methyltransferase domain-containing protein, partial [Acidobacteria bacterium]|nr:methyltransferase domain-containing protein [Acidobacteriota bacterium]
MENINPGYTYRSTDPSCTAEYLWPAVSGIITTEIKPPGPVFEIGCGNGAFSKRIASLGYAVTAVDSSETGIEVARHDAGGVRFEVGSGYDDLAATYGPFPAVVSLEVIEHCFWPRRLVATAFNLLEPGGVLMLSTPYHGYLKNLVLALFNRMDFHWSPLWDGGH